jgi:putative SOS response-associated peptidase YedK
MPPRFNVAPTQEIPTVTESREGERRLRLLRWGLVPHWAKSLAIGQQMINAKSETLDEKPAFKTAFQRRRCLIPADGFFEWSDVPVVDQQGSLFAGEATTLTGKTRKQPYHIRLKGGKPFAFAGLWERWSDPEGHIVDSCTIITAPSNSLIAPLHDRMPVILDPQDYGRWLDRHFQATEELQPLLVPYQAQKMEMTAVNPVVGNPRIDSPDCIQPFNAA